MAETYPIAYVYVITNTVNGKQYVGQTTHTVTKRWKQHCDEAIKRGRGCRVLRDAILKYGQGAFTIHAMTLERVTQEALDSLERRLIEAFGSLVPTGYNLRSGGEGGGQRLSPESRARLSESLRGRKYSLQTRERLRVSHLGQERTPETRAKISASMKGIKRTAEHQRKLAESRRGKPLTDAQRETMRKMWLAKPKSVSAETRDRLRHASAGRVYSEATRQKLRIAKQAWWDNKKQQRSGGPSLLEP